MSGLTAAPLLHPPAAALGEGSTGAGGAGVPAHGAVAGHLTRGVTTTGDNRAGVPALVAKKSIHDILWICQMPSRYVDTLRRDEGQDFCLDMI